MGGEKTYLLNWRHTRFNASLYTNSICHTSPGIDGKFHGLELYSSTDLWKFIFPQRLFVSQNQHHNKTESPPTFRNQCTLAWNDEVWIQEERFYQEKTRWAKEGGPFEKEGIRPSHDGVGCVQ